MCGIAGIVSLYGERLTRSQIKEMTESLYHRGPDFGKVCYFDFCHLGHRRLSIIDLRADANQPFHSRDRRYSIVYNGEIYNYQELKDELTLKGVQFRTSSDTEVLLEAYLAYGKKVIHKLNGIFAFAIWDEHKNELFGARDHLGVKPFYYILDQGKLAFASEIKALLSVKKAELNRPRVGEFLQFGAVSGEETLFKNILRLKPGHTIQFKKKQVVINEYYNSFQTKSEDDFTDREGIEETLLDSIRLQMVSDVPVGAMCSGGIDSSYVSVKCSGYSDIPLNAFTVKIPYGGYDETKYARQVVSSSDLLYNEIEFESSRARRLLPTLIWLHDEPLRHPNSIPIFEISRLAKKKITVLLSGEGADEIFGGYGTYKRLKTVNRLKKIPRFILRLMLLRARRIGSGKEVILAALQQDRVCKLLMLRANLPQSEIRELLKDDGYEENFRINLMKSALKESKGDEVNALMYYDQYTHLQTLLDRQDKMCMGNSIESRVPFLDHRIVTSLNRLSSKVKMSKGKTKSLLRDYASKILPESIFNRPKYPFGVPLFQQYIGDKSYQDALRDLPMNSYLVKDKIISSDKLKELVNSFFEGTGYYDDIVWNVYNLELWYKIFIKEELDPDLSELPAYNNLSSTYENFI